MATQRPMLHDYHRMFGLLLADYFLGSPFTVERERDLSLQKQLLDVVIVRRRRGRFPDRLADGLEDLVDHNLITFKSHHQALDSWAMKELVGHSVAYRKLVSPRPSALLPEEQFRLYAVCARLPKKLARQVPWQERQAGVYDCTWGTDTIRVVVAGELPKQPHNAPLHLFSASAKLMNFGGREYKPRSAETSGLLDQLFDMFRGEGLAVSYSMKDFKREYMKEHLPELTPNEQVEVLQALPPEARLAGLPPEARLAGLPPEARLAGLSPEQLEQIRQYLDQVTVARSAPARRRRRKT